MDKLVSTSVCWPKPPQELLLRAALGDRAEAIPAWERFEDEQGLDDLDEGTFRLLPQMYRNLNGHCYPSAVMGRLKGIHRKAWVKNQMLFHDIAPVMRTLHTAGIPTMMLKGVALTLGIYEDRGARPMRDFDLLVPTDEADHTLEVLAAQGWRSSAGFAMRLKDKQLRYRHAIELVSPSGRMLDLHWHLLYHARGPGADAEFWKQAWPCYLDQERSLILAPTHQLLHILVHGIEGNAISPVRWVSDAMVTIRSRKIDWEHLVEITRKNDVVLPVRDGLRYLQDTFQAPIPRSVVWRLERDQVNRFTQMEYHRHLQPGLLHSPTVTVASTYRGYLRGVRDWSWWQRLAGFPDYLAFLMQLPSARHLPGKFAGWVGHRIRTIVASLGSIGSAARAGGT